MRGFWAWLVGVAFESRFWVWLLDVALGMAMGMTLGMALGPEPLGQTPMENDQG
jgi:hypothetical protein